MIWTNPVASINFQILAITNAHATPPLRPRSNALSQAVALFAMLKRGGRFHQRNSRLDSSTNSGLEVLGVVPGFCTTAASTQQFCELVIPHMS